MSNKTKCNEPVTKWNLAQ